jgi:CubicO group peptidase (beta-lactamase class C family)
MRWVALVLVLAACKSKSEPATTSAPTGSAVLPAADATQPKGLAEEVAAIRTKLGLPGVAAAAWRDGKLIEQTFTGLRTAGEPGGAIGEHDLWHLGSNTKAMTATLIGIHVDRGSLRWTDTIGMLLGPTKAKIDPGYKDVTLDQLIRHEGGAPEQPPDAVWKQLWADGTAPDARSKFVRAILGARPAQKPGTFVYSNASYMIAGAMLEAKIAKPWEQLAAR